jgi:hypothetical protein
LILSITATVICVFALDHILGQLESWRAEGRLSRRFLRHLARQWSFWLYAAAAAAPSLLGLLTPSLMPGNSLTFFTVALFGTTVLYAVGKRIEMTPK